MGSSARGLNLRQCSCVSGLWEAKCPFATREVAIVRELGGTSETGVSKSYKWLGLASEGVRIWAHCEMAI